MATGEQYYRLGSGGVGFGNALPRFSLPRNQHRLDDAGGELCDPQATRLAGPGKPARSAGASHRIALGWAESWEVAKGVPNKRTEV
jgi:hypothetical protein